MNRLNADIEMSDEALNKAVMGTAEKEDVTVEALVENLSYKLGVRRERVTKSLYVLRKVEKVALKDLDPPRSLLRYAWSTYSLWFWTLLVLAALTAVSIYLFPQMPPYIYLRYISGSLFTLYLPGYALIETLYPVRRGLTSLERFTLSIGLSLALVTLVGFALNYTPWGIRLDPIFTCLSILTVLLAFTALARRFSYFKLKESPFQELRGEG